jgi:hydrogenase maturation protease
MRVRDVKSYIICIGNRLLPEDASGPAVFDYLQRLTLPRDIEIIEGGTAGLNLLPLLERGGRVVFVDTVTGFTNDGDIILLDQKTLIQSAANPSFGHDAGLPYVLSLLPKVCDGPMPQEIILIGLEGQCDAQVIDRAAMLSVSIAVNGL